MVARISQMGLDRIFDGRETPPVFAGAAFPPCAATVVDGGIRVSGEVRFVSGCEDADWVFAVAMVAPEDGRPHSEEASPDIRVIFVPRSDITVLGTWQVMGMRGSGSSDVALNDVLVANELTASMVPPPEPLPPFSSTMLAVFPWPVILGEAVVSLGIAAAALDTATELATRKVPANASEPTAARELTQVNLARARAQIESARTYLDSTLAIAVAAVSAQSVVPMDVKVSLQLAACFAAESGARAVELVYEAMGSSAFFDRVGLERHFRDAHVLTQHGTKSAARYVSAGRVMLGLPSDSAALR